MLPLDAARTLLDRATTRLRRTGSRRRQAGARTRVLVLIAAAVLPVAIAAPAHARGFLVPSGPIAPGAAQAALPWRLESEHLEIQVRGAKASAVVTQVIRNVTNQPLEAMYFVPVPPGMDIRRVNVLQAGEKMFGTLQRDKAARAAFDTLLRRNQNIELARFVGQDMYGVRLQPIAPNTSVKFVLTYDQTVHLTGGISEWIHATNGAFAGPRDGVDFSAHVTVQTERRIGPMYCPSYNIEMRPGYGESATAVIETRLLPHDPDVCLYWAASGSRVGATLLTYWPEDEPKGYFLFIAQPALGTVESRATQPKCITFVIDASSSMAGEKLAQVQAGLRRVIATLNPKDHFNLIAYNSDVAALWDEPRLVSPDSQRSANTFLDQIRTAAGTDIEGALRLAIKARRPDMSSAVMLLIDGRPTFGEVDTHKILGAVRAAQGPKPVRIFALGVGVDVNSVLLDRLSLDSRGVPAYVRPREDIEPHVSALYERLRYPVLTDVSYRFEGMHADSVLPKSPADLFRGNQMVLAGRYAKGGPVELVVQGRDVISRQYHYVLQAAKRGGGVRYDFPARVWATRRVAALIDDIRLHQNQNPTLVDEIVRLATRFGVVTEYTSYLAINVELSFASNRRSTLTSMQAQVLRNVGNISWAQSQNQVLRRGATQVPRGEQELYVPGQNDRDVEQVRIPIQRGAWPRVIANRTFVRRPNGGWVDSAIEDPTQVDERIARWSERFFEIVEEADPAVNARIAQAGGVLLRINNKTVQITD